MTDDHVRLLRRVAKSWRQRTHAHRAADHDAGSVGASRQADAVRSSAMAEARLATAERERRADRSAADTDPPPNLPELEAVARHARDRVALQRRRAYLGKGDPRKLAELEREASGAEGRLRDARRRAHRDASSS